MMYPPLLYLNRRASDGELMWSEEPLVMDNYPYIRFDGFKEIIDFTNHKKFCDLNGGPESSIKCTCGLTDLLKSYGR